MSKSKTIASGCWYAVRHRAIPYIGKHAVALLTFAFFIYLYGVSGGVDVRHLTDTEATIRILVGFGIWLMSLAVVMVIKGIKAGKEGGRRNKPI